MDMQIRVWRKDDVIALLDASDKAVVNAIKGLYARQTEAERADKTTRIANGRGFNAKDAPFLSDIAIKLPKYSDRMTAKQLYVARKMLRKYWKQLLQIIQEKGGVVEFPTSLKREIQNSANQVDAEQEANEAEIALAAEIPSITGTATGKWGIF